MMCYTYDDRDWVTNRRTVDLVTEEYTDDPFTYDAAGNLQNLIGDNTPTYDSNNRLTEYQGNALHYDAEGNMEVTPFADYYVQHYTYDTKNRLISDQIEFSASYNADNLRYRVTDRDDINLYDHTYLSDTNCRLSRALVRYDNYTDNVTYYLHGLGLVGEYTNGSFKTYHFDYRGSTVAITDNTGNIIDTFEYDTYGKQTARTGNTDTPFRYNGRDGVMTEYNGLLYMRARYYSPDMRRFISADILPGGIDNAVTLNRYAYANANPVTNIDPFGLCAERGSTQNGWTEFWESIKNKDGSYSLYDNHRHHPYSTFHEQILSLSGKAGVDLGSGELGIKGTLSGYTGGWEFDYVDLSLLDFLTVELGIGVVDEYIGFDAQASIWTPSITVTIFDIDVTVEAHVGSIGAQFSTEDGKFKVGASYGWGISLGFGFN